MGRFESLNFDFCVFSFDTMKRISFAKVAKNLNPNGFRQKEKEREYRINTCVPICLTTPPLIQITPRLQFEVAGCNLCFGVANGSLRLQNKTKAFNIRNI